MARLGKIIKGTRYQVGRFAGKWYVVDLDHMKFIYGPFVRRQTAEARIYKLIRAIGTRNPLTQRKARTILHEGSARGYPLTEKQRRFFGARSSGYPQRKINPKQLPQLALLRLPVKPAPRINPRSTGIRQIFRRDIERVGGKWYILDYTGFKPEVLKGPYSSLSDAQQDLRIMKSRRRYTTSKRYHAKLGFRTKYKGGQKPHQNPRSGVLIYGRVLKIFAQKTSGPFKGQRFVHSFKSGAVMMGMPDGSIRIVHP